MRILNNRLETSHRGYSLLAILRTLCVNNKTVKISSINYNVLFDFDFLFDINVEFC